MWTNPRPGTYPNLTSSDPADPLANTAPEFSVTSSTVHPDFADQFNLLRHGDDLIVRFRVVLIDPQYYDREAYVDVRQERPASTPPGTDPTESFPINTQTEIWWEEFCTNTERTLLVNDNDTAQPEDIDVDVSGTELNFILTDTDALPLTVQLRNRGGHDARDYFAYVTFGEAMQVQSAPGSCSVTTNPPPMPEWQLPVGIPASATVYACNPGMIRPGQTRSLNFQVRKNPNATDDDLTFRADVTGEVTLSDGTPLWFPTPQNRGDGILPRANDYTVDAVRARVVGYNLTKEQLGTCSENNPPPGPVDDQVQIGEECSFHIESGGWFGFLTPGYDYIEIENVQVVDRIPDGQGYISSTDPLAPGYSTDQVHRRQPEPPAGAARRRAVRLDAQPGEPHHGEGSLVPRRRDDPAAERPHRRQRGAEPARRAEPQRADLDLRCGVLQPADERGRDLHARHVDRRLPAGVPPPRGPDGDRAEPRSSRRKCVSRRTTVWARPAATSSRSSIRAMRSTPTSSGSRSPTRQRPTGCDACARL